MKEQAFAAIDLFSSLGPDELRSLAEIAIARDYQAGEDIFYEGDPCAGIWVVAAGSVKIVKTTPSGRQVMLGVQNAPSTVAEVPVFDGGPYPATVTALEPSTALLVLKGDFLALCRRHPEVTLRFLRVFSARLRHLVNLVERITFGNVRQRLARTLLEFGNAAGSNHFTMPETHEQLAMRLGTVREVISRNLGRFQAEKLLRLQRREVEILDREGLLAEAETEI